MGNQIVRPVTATVYQGARRRYFTKRAAYMSLARAAVLRKYPCECDPEVGFECGLHDEFLTKRWDRLARLLEMWDSRAGGAAP